MMRESYVQGLSETRLLGMTIGAALERAAREHGAHEALVACAEGVRLDYAGLDALVDQVAAGLIGLGLVRGERIGIFSPNNVAWAVLQFASAKAGLILVTINPAYRTAELEYVLNAVQCAALVLAPRFKSSDYIAMLEGIPADRLPHLRLRIVIGDAPSGMMRFDDIAAHADAASERHWCGCGRICSSTIRSISSSPRAPRARRKEQRSRIITCSITDFSWARGSGCGRRTGSVFRCRSIIVSAW
jgi:Acyl-CoA synthetases (AMP-forming)/AMP-acid ligases II